MLCGEAARRDLPALPKLIKRAIQANMIILASDPVRRSLDAAGWPLYAGPCEVSCEIGDREAGQREIFVVDPDGYLVMVADDLGERPLPEARS